MIPQRETYAGHQCRCAIPCADGYPDACPNTVYNPDQPFCDECEDQHADLRATFGVSR